MKTTLKIGDRFQHKGLDVWEIISLPYTTLRIYRAVCVCSNDSQKLGFQDEFGFRSNDWEYIGNFAKAKNFNNLYNLLNEE